MGLAEGHELLRPLRPLPNSLLVGRLPKVGWVLKLSFGGAGAGGFVFAGDTESLLLMLTSSSIRLRESTGPFLSFFSSTGSMSSLTASLSSFSVASSFCCFFFLL